MSIKEKFQNLASSALRWGTAEAIAAGIARDNESEPFTLMLTDLAGLTDSAPAATPAAAGTPGLTPRAA